MSSNSVSEPGKSHVLLRLGCHEKTKETKFPTHLKALHGLFLDTLKFLHQGSDGPVGRGTAGCMVMVRHFIDSSPLPRLSLLLPQRVYRSRLVLCCSGDASPLHRTPPRSRNPGEKRNAAVVAETGKIGKTGKTCQTGKTCKNYFLAFFT